MWRFDHKGIDAMIAGDHAVNYKTVETARLDTAAMRKDFVSDVVDEYIVRSTTKRFSVR